MVITSFRKKQLYEPAVMRDLGSTASRAIHLQQRVRAGRVLLNVNVLLTCTAAKREKHCANAISVSVAPFMLSIRVDSRGT